MSCQGLEVSIFPLVTLWQTPEAADPQLSRQGSDGPGPSKLSDGLSFVLRQLGGL